MLAVSSLLAGLGPRTRKLLRYAGLTVLALVSFVFAFQLTFPFDRVKDKIVDALAEKYEVNIGDVERGIIPGRVYFKAFSIRTRPAKAGDVATTFYIDRLGIDLGLFALLRGAVSVGIDARIGPGQIKGKVALSGAGTSVHLAGDDLPSASLPVREALGLPMSGKVRLRFDLDLPNEKSKTGKVSPNWPKAEGGVEFACPSGCTIGDGKSKLKLTTNNVRQQEFLDQGGGGIDFGKVNIDSLVAKVEIKDGKLEVTRFDTRSPDGDLKVAFSMMLNQDIQASLVTGCLRFRGSDALLKREPKTHAAFSTTGAPLGPDNLFHIKLDGPLRQMRRIGVVCGPTVNTSMDNPGGTPPRPNLSVTPEPARPPGLGTVSNTPVMPAPPPPAATTPPPGAMPPSPSAAGANPPGSDAAHPPGTLGEAPAPTVYPSNGSAPAMPGAAPAPAVPPAAPPAAQPPAAQPPANQPPPS